MSIKKKVIISIFAIVSATIFTFVVYIWLTISGNPLTKMEVNSDARKYVKENYKDIILEIKKASFDYKSSQYAVLINNKTHTGFLKYSKDGTFKRASLSYNPTLEAEKDFRYFIRSIHKSETFNPDTGKKPVYVSLGKVSIVEPNHDNAIIIDSFDKSLLIDLEVRFLEYDNINENLMSLMSYAMQKLNDYVVSEGYNVKNYIVEYDGYSTEKFSIIITPSDVENGVLRNSYSTP